MPIQIVDLTATKAPSGVYAAGTTADVTLKNPHKFPWHFNLLVSFIAGQKIVDSESITGFMKGGDELPIHSETTWSAEKVQAKVGTTRLFLLAETKEVDP